MMRLACFAAVLTMNLVVASRALADQRLQNAYDYTFVSCGLEGGQLRATYKRRTAAAVDVIEFTFRDKSRNVNAREAVIRRRNFTRGVERTSLIAREFGPAYPTVTCTGKGSSDVGVVNLSAERCQHPALPVIDVGPNAALSQAAVVGRDVYVMLDVAFNHFGEKIPTPSLDDTAVFLRPDEVAPEVRFVFGKSTPSPQSAILGLSDLSRGHHELQYGTSYGPGDRDLVTGYLCFDV